MRRILYQLLLYVALAILTLWASFPSIWVMLSSIKPFSELFSGSLSILPTVISFTFYERVLTMTMFTHHFFNSIIVALGATAITVIVGTMGSYSLSREFYGKESTINHLILFIYMFPNILMIIPYYTLARSVYLDDTLLMLSITHAAMSIAFVLWFMKAYFDTVSRDLDEAAATEGANDLQIFYRIIFPLAVPGIAAAAIFVFMNSWNDFLFSFILISSEENKTLPLSLYSFGLRGTGGGELNMLGELLAASTMMMIPQLIFAFLVQKWLVAGLTAGAVRG